jgi:hypothetical protein
VAMFTAKIYFWDLLLRIQNKRNTDESWRYTGIVT